MSDGGFVEDSKYFYAGFTWSLLVHCFLLLLLTGYLGIGIEGLDKEVIYSVTIEGGKSIGGVSQVAKPDDKSKEAPYKKVQEVEKKKEEKVEETEKKVADPELVKKEEKKIAEEKKKEIEKKLADEKKKKEDEEKKKKEEEKKKKEKEKEKELSKEDIDKQLQKAVQKYTGNSTDAHGQGFGAAKLGGKGMGGGVLRPPEFFQYKKILEDRIKGGWSWPNTKDAFVTKIQFDISPDGQISNVSIVQRSGNPIFDESVERAVYKGNPLPPPPGVVYEFFKSIVMTFDPRD